MEDKKHLKLNRKAFKIQTFEEASNQRQYWLQKSPQERLVNAWFLICQTYGLDYEKHHPLNRTIFRVRKWNE